MKKRVHIATLACIAVVASIISTSAFAVASSLTVTGPTATKLTLFSQSGSKVASGVGDMSADKLPPGSYQVVAEDASGQTKTTNIQVEEDTSCNYRVNENGDAERIRCVALAGQQQQQQQREEGPWSLVAMGGYKRTPYNGFIDTNFGNSGGVGLEDSGGVFSLESRYHFPNADGTRDHTFAYAGIDWYAGLDKRRMTLDFHPTPGHDTGASMEEKWGGSLGLGKEWDLPYYGSRIELTGGAHITKVKASVSTNESGGGGVYNRFTKDKTLISPSLGVGVTWPIMGEVRGIARYRMDWMQDVTVRGMSTLGFDYVGEISGGRQDTFQLGFEMPIY